MRFVSKSEYIDIKGQIWRVNALPSGLYLQMLNRMLDQLFIMLDHHSKVMVIRTDLRQPTYTVNNARMTKFNRRLFKWLKSNYNFKRIGYVWVREQEKANHQHYHYSLILDGHKINYPHKVMTKAGEIWQSMGGKDHKPRNCYYNLKRGEFAEIQEAVYRISYFAKARGKGSRPSQTKDYSTSRIKPPD